MPEQRKTVELKGKICAVLFHNNDNDWSVVKCTSDEGTETVTGTIIGARKDMEIVVHGEYINHPKYGTQIKAESVVETMPATVAGIEGFLGSGTIKGVGPEFAKRIVERFGEDTFDIIEKEAERLLEVEGIGKKRLGTITDSYEKQNMLRDICVVLQGYDISVSFATRIYKEYGEKSLMVLKKNPYKIADDIHGFGFKTADQIALKMGVKKESPSRIKSGIRYVLEQAAQSGHCFLYEKQVLKNAGEILEVSKDLIKKELDDAAATTAVITEEERVYLPVYYRTEEKVARNLVRIKSGTKEPVQKRADTGVSYDRDQEEAINMALDAGCCYITGGPGTGKTTITNAVVKSIKEDGQTVLLAAPTGRAAKRLSEACGHEAKTIHRTLEVNNEGYFKRDEENPLEGDVLIVDECSMLDLMLANSLFAAVPDNMRLILVGDADQLPSVGAGNVFSDIMASGVIDGTRLTEIHRQAQGNKIITNAHKINNGFMPDKGNGNGFYSFKANDDEKAAEMIVKFYTHYIPQKFGKDVDIQVLAPIKKGACGVFRLNNLLQEALNPGHGGINAGGYRIRKGDRVMQMRNNYDLGVLNGDIGVVKSIDEEEGKAVVMMDEREVEYDDNAADDLSLAYAATVHKSQGSEYGVVVMPMLRSHYVMLERNLFYTAVTRAKDVFVMIGAEDAVQIAVNKKDARKRQTTLSGKLIKTQNSI